MIERSFVEAAFLAVCLSGVLQGGGGMGARRNFYRGGHNAFGGNRNVVKDFT